jgi:hypothetical protein
VYLEYRRYSLKLENSREFSAVLRWYQSGRVEISLPQGNGERRFVTGGLSSATEQRWRGWIKAGALATLDSVTLEEHMEVARGRLTQAPAYTSDASISELDFGASYPLLIENLQSQAGQFPALPALVNAAALERAILTFLDETSRQGQP